MSDETSTFRLYLMRLLYLGNFVLLGLDVWPVLIKHEGAWDPVRALPSAFGRHCRPYLVWEFDIR